MKYLAFIFIFLVAPFLLYADSGILTALMYEIFVICIYLYEAKQQESI